MLQMQTNTTPLLLSPLVQRSAAHALFLLAPDTDGAEDPLLCIHREQFA